MMLKMDQWLENIEWLFSDGNVFRCIYGFKFLQSLGPLQWLLVFQLELTGVFYVCSINIQPSSNFVILMDMFQHFGVRWMDIPL